MANPIYRGKLVLTTDGQNRVYGIVQWPPKDDNKNPDPRMDDYMRIMMPQLSAEDRKLVEDNPDFPFHALVQNRHSLEWVLWFLQGLGYGSGYPVFGAATTNMNEIWVASDTKGITFGGDRPKPKF